MLKGKEIFDPSKWWLTRPVSLTSEEQMLEGQKYKRQHKKDSGDQGCRRK